MNSLLRFSGWIALSGLMVGSAFAAPQELEITANKRKMDSKKQVTESSTMTSERWAYKTTLTNKTFKPIQGLKVDYRIYIEKDSFKDVPPKLIATPGSTTIASLDANRKFTFETDSVEIKMSTLRSGWDWTGNNPKEKSEDEVVGIWIRVMRNGELVAEYMKPTTLKNKAKWE